MKIQCQERNMNMPYAYCHDCTKAIVTLVPQLWYKCDNSHGTSVTIALVQV